MDQQGAIDSDPATKYGNNSTFVINISLSYAKARYYSEILERRENSFRGFKGERKNDSFITFEPAYIK